MDTSEKFVKMCEKAPGVQKKTPLFKERLNSFFFMPEQNQVAFNGWTEVVGFPDGIGGYGMPDYVWLPRQDQLLDLLGDFAYQKDRIGVIFTPAMQPSGKWLPYWAKFESMEQIWLALYMVTKHEKCWDFEKEEWVRQ